MGKVHDRPVPPPHWQVPDDVDLYPECTVDVAAVEDDEGRPEVLAAFAVLLLLLMAVGFVEFVLRLLPVVVAGKLFNLF